MKEHLTTLSKVHEVQVMQHYLGARHDFQLPGPYLLAMRPDEVVFEEHDEWDGVGRYGEGNRTSLHLAHHGGCTEQLPGADHSRAAVDQFHPIRVQHHPSPADQAGHELVAKKGQ